MSIYAVRRRICIYLYEPMKELKENAWENWRHFKKKQKMFSSQTFSRHPVTLIYTAHVQPREMEINGSSIESNISQFSFNVFA